MKVRFLSAGCFVLGLMTVPASAQFSGTFELTPPGCQQQGQCTLTFDFKYTDPNGVGWQAAAQNQTDGASIPAWAQPFIGDPFDPAYIQAAVIHDHYCDRHVRSWRATHRVFYDALLDLGLSQSKAKLMYYAVYLGGPKWIHLIPGNPCGPGCINVEVPESIAGQSRAFELEAGAGLAMEVPLQNEESTDAGMVIARAADYDEPGFVEELKEVEALLDAEGDQIDLDYLERRATDRRPNDFFYENASQIELGSRFVFE